VTDRLAQSTTEYGAHQLAIAAVLLTNFFAIILYSLWRTDARREILRVGALLNLVGAACWGLPGLLVGPEAPERLQGIAYNLKAVPFDAATAYVCLLLAESLAKKHPRLEAVLRSSWWVLALFMLYSMLFAVLRPLPALEEFERAPASFLLFKARNLPEIFYVTLAGAVFFLETFRSGVRPRTLRLQNACFSLASIFFFLLLAGAIFASVVRVLPLPPERVEGLIALHLAQERLLLVLGGLSYTAGLFLYHSGEEQQRLLGRFLRWIRYRRNLEIDFDFYYGDRFGQKLVARRLQAAARRRRLPPTEADAAQNVLKLAGLLYVREDRDLLVRNLHDFQAELLKDTDLASRIFVRIEGNVRYDVRDDALFRAIDPALELADARTEPDLLDRPEWVQLAALATDDAGLLPAPKKGTFLRGRTIRGSVLSAYNKPLDDRNVRRRLDPGGAA
jgi:hypothetical protein